MPNWTEVLEEINKLSHDVNATDVIRNKYLHALQKKTGRNIIAYYSGWLQRPSMESGISDLDQNSFMTMISDMAKSKNDGLDLILHTPGGNIAATEALGYYLKKIFNNDIRVIVPHLAMSAGTMIACCAKEILMGKHSSLGPTDPQFSSLNGSVSASAVLEEFESARRDVVREPKLTQLWQTIVSKYPIALLIESQKACEWSEDIVNSWLLDNMFQSDSNKDVIAGEIAKLLGDHNESKNHNKHFSICDLRKAGLKVQALETDQELQDIVLTIHHVFMYTFAMSKAVKIIENHNGIKRVSVDNSMPIQSLIHPIPKKL